MMGLLERTPSGSDATESVSNLTNYTIHVALTQGSRVIAPLLVEKNDGYFTATLLPERTRELRGEFGLEAAIIVDNNTLVSNNVEGITIEGSALGRVVSKLTTDNTPSYTTEVDGTAVSNNVSTVYNYCIKLSVVSSEISINAATESEAALFTLTFGKTLVGKSAYEIAVDYGYEGTEEEWINSLLQSDLSNLAPASITSSMTNFPEYLSVKLLDNDDIDTRTSGVYAVCNYNPDSTAVVNNNIYRLLIVSNEMALVNGGVTTTYYQTLVTGNSMMRRTGTYTTWGAWSDASSSMRNLYTAKGDFTYNTETGYYEKGSITDLTENDMANIFATYTYSYSTEEGAYAYSSARATPTFNVYGITSAAYTFAYSGIELVDYGSLLSYWISGYAVGIFFQCTALREIVGAIDLGEVTYLSNMFFNCSALESVKIENLSSDINLGYSPLLTAESVHYLIIHADDSADRRLTLHADCLDRIYEDALFEYNLDKFASQYNVSIAVA